MIPVLFRVFQAGKCSISLHVLQLFFFFFFILKKQKKQKQDLDHWCDEENGKWFFNIAGFDMIEIFCFFFIKL